ncbi:MAG: hypothetical protein EPN64_00125 [Burkholderiaceae bacterium]|nr:MAG: hypothetical protein EPN64_00125 [Burkholderiaceae bacterium]
MKTAAYLFCLAASALPLAHAQSICTSDGVRAPVALVERFINADCASCWSDAATPKVGDDQLAIDWIVPSDRGDDAPLSAAATRDALSRLKALDRSAPKQTLTITTRVTGSGAAALPLRVAHGVSINNYIGTSIRIKPAPVIPAGSGPWTAWLLLVETVPKGVEGTPVPRNLVRNSLQSLWNNNSTLSNDEQTRLEESRPMQIPPDADPKHLRVVGWVQDAQGHVLAAAQSRCEPGD